MVAATGLWNEADPVRERGQSGSDSRLARAVHALIFDTELEAGGLAFVDGGVETVLCGSPDECWGWFTARLAMPWDALDNPLLIWTR